MPKKTRVTTKKAESSTKATKKPSAPRAKAAAAMTTKPRVRRTAKKPPRRLGLRQFIDEQLVSDSTLLQLDVVRAAYLQKYPMTADQFEAVVTSAKRSRSIIEVDRDGQRMLATKMDAANEQAVFEFLKARAALQPKPKCSEKVFLSLLPKVEAELRLKLAAEQLAVLRAYFVDGLRTLIVHGYAGSGKTTLMAAIRQFHLLLGTADTKMLGTALAGKAVQRLQTASGLPAQTLHSAFRLKMNPKAVLRKLTAVLKLTIVVVDESSMISSNLLIRTLSRLPETVDLLFVGDPKQLPPIGQGQPFADMIFQKCLPVFALRHRHRSGEGNILTDIVHEIRRNRVPVFESTLDCFQFNELDTEEEMLEAIVAQSRLAMQRNTALTSFQVMTLTHHGLLGTVVLNNVLQDTLNPAVGQAEMYLNLGTAGREVIFRLGDKIIHHVNSIQRAVEVDALEELQSGRSAGRLVRLTNGLLGKVVAIDQLRSMLFVEYPEISKIVRYTRKDAQKALELAWCLTLHKCQGSEFDQIIMPLLNKAAHRRIASNAALYTAATRAKTQVYLCGDRSFFELLCSEDGSRITGYYGPKARKTYLQCLLSADKVQ